MLELLNIGRPSEPESPGEVALPNVNNRSVRLIVRKAYTSNTVGVQEFQLFSPAGLNYCYDAGFRPVAVMAQGAEGSTPPYIDPYSTIDGNWINWASTAYVLAAIDNSRFIQYNFLKDIDPRSWKFKSEGNWIPMGADGLSLQIYRNNRWVDITGTTATPGNWGSTQFITFSI